MRWCCRSQARTGPASLRWVARSRRSQPRSIANASKATHRARPSNSSTRAGPSRRLLVIGTGGGTPSHEAAEKLGGTAAARLLTSGETKAVIDVSGLGFDADSAARVGLARGASLVALRPLSNQAQGQAKADADRSNDRRRRRRRRQTLRPTGGSRWLRRLAHPRTRHRAGKHHLSGKLRRPRPRVARRNRHRNRSARSAGDGEARNGRASRRRPRLHPPAAAPRPAVERWRKRVNRQLSSAKA